MDTRGWRRIGRTVWMLFAALAVAGCDDGGDGDLPPACAEVDCGGHGHCELDVERAPICVCDTGYTGEGCVDCAAGYTADDDRCVAVTIDCEVDPTVCGEGVCLPGPVDTCQCPIDRVGRACEQCAPGYQDHDEDGNCSSSCAQYVCVAPQFCDDSTGDAQCRCPGGLTGSNCDECQPGYTAVETEAGLTCRATCQVLECNPGGACSELGVEAACVCALGHTGPGCETCTEPGAEPDDEGRCVVPMPTSSALVALRPAQGGQSAMLGVVDLADGHLTPVERRLDVSFSFSPDIDIDLTTGVIYGTNSFEIVSLDVTNGLQRIITALPEDRGITQAGPVLDPTGTTLYMAFATFDAIRLAAVDIASGELTELGTVARRGLRSLALDEAGEQLLVLTGNELVAFDLASGVATTRFELALPGATVVGPWPAARVGDTLVSAVASLSPERWASSRCTNALRELGRDPAGWAEPTVVAMPRRVAGDPVDPVVLASDTEADAPPLLVFSASSESSVVGTPTEPIPVEIRSAHPDAVACVVSSGQPVALTVPAGTRLAHLVVVLQAATGSSLTVDAGFEPSAPQYTPIVLVDDAGQLSLDLPDSVGVTYTDFDSLGFDAFRAERSSSVDTLLTLDLERGTLTQRPIAPLGTLGGLAWIP